MIIRALLPLALVLPAPAFAETIFDTHTVVPMPSGKTVKMFRPIAWKDCVTVAPHHQSGKMPLQPTADGQVCAKKPGYEVARNSPK
ncbi:hypothetical protein ACVWZA_003466 [Sphingomonas sp. UYAg733]